MHKPVDGAEALAHKVLSDFGRFPSAGAVPYFVTVEAMLAHSAALVAENERLREALKPFAALADEWVRWQSKGSTSTPRMIQMSYGKVRFGLPEYQAARDAIRAIPVKADDRERA